MDHLEVKKAFGKKMGSNLQYEKGYSGNIRTWDEIHKYVEGLFIGTRTYFEGTLNGSYFTQKRHITVGLIVPGYRENPIPVPLRSCFFK